MAKLHAKMTLQQFETGYWYAVELKEFAKSLGVKGFSRLRKDQLEALIRLTLQGESVIQAETKPRSSQNADKLALDHAVENYVSNRATKDFILAQAQTRHPALPSKSGRWYWLNRWREQQIEDGLAITYADLVEQMVKLCLVGGRLPQIPSARFNNFISDFLAAGAGNREEACLAWDALKQQKLPKTFDAWQRSQR